jgi:WhiB family transcriptional regulator, redox-sensing transcriptional regulator
MTSFAREPAGGGGPPDRSPAPGAGDWREQAVCAGIGDWLFFATKGQEQFTQRAKAVCRTCPVASPCLEFALEMEAQPGFLGHHGVFGGKSAREREAIARARKQQQRSNAA